MNQQRRQRRRLLAATALVIFLLLADIVSGGRLRHAVRAAGASLWQAGSAVIRSVGLSGIFSSRASLASQNAALQAEVAQLQDKAAAYAAVQQENEQLRALVHLTAAASGITAPVTSSFSASPYGTFTIGAGTSDLVQGGAKVSTPDGFVIGRVSDVAARSALVAELFAPGQSLEVLIGDTALVLHGDGGGQAEAEAPRAARISVGDSVVAPSLGQRAVGVVGAVQRSEASASTRVFVRIPVNLSSLSFVYVETTH